MEVKDENIRGDHHRSVTEQQEDEPQNSAPHNKVGKKRAQQRDDDMMKPISSPAKKLDSSSNSKQLESARAEMGQVREENERLKMHLNRITKDYETLQMQFFGTTTTTTTSTSVYQLPKKLIDLSSSDDYKQLKQLEIEEHPDQLVSLSLGRFSSSTSTDSKKDLVDQKNNNNNNNNNNKTHANYNNGESIEKNKLVIQGLSLGLDCKFETTNSSSSKGDIDGDQLNISPSNSLQEAKEETWPPSKLLKTPGDAETNSQQNPTKKARVSVRTRCDTPTMNDGCQWRKYGQKIAKGNPCPRAYYRCTVAPSCPVRKQVQRSFEDMSILITTYEGIHNHPLPIAATAMASTTSAAASMLLSGSSSSTSASNNSSFNLHGLNFYLSDNTKSKQFYSPNSNNPLITPSPTCPTITLDLTNTASSSSPFINRSSFPNSNYPPSISFGSSQSSSWGTANQRSILSYATQQQQPLMKTPLNHAAVNPLNLGRQQIENIYQSYMQKNPSSFPHQQSTLPADTIAAATKAITLDPSFQSALAAALTSIIGNTNTAADQGVNINSGQKSKWINSTAETIFPMSSSTNFSTSPKANINACASSYLMNKQPSPTTTSSDQQPGSLMLVPPNTLPFSASKSASPSPGDSREHAP